MPANVKTGYVVTVNQRLSQQRHLKRCQLWIEKYIIDQIRQLSLDDNILKHSDSFITRKVSWVCVRWVLCTALLINYYPSCILVCPCSQRVVVVVVVVDFFRVTYQWLALYRVVCHCSIEQTYTVWRENHQLFLEGFRKAVFAVYVTQCYNYSTHSRDGIQV